LEDNVADPAPSQEVQDNTDRFMLRVAEHLETLPTPAARVAWLSKQRARWIVLFERFAERIDSGRKPEFGETAWDYQLTICALDARLALEKRRAAA
jgi:hypothetical protein